MARKCKECGTDISLLDKRCLTCDSCRGRIERERRARLAKAFRARAKAYRDSVKVDSMSSETEST